MLAPDAAAPFEVGPALRLSAVKRRKFRLESRFVELVCVLGLKPGASYDVEVDDEEMREGRAGAF